MLKRIRSRITPSTLIATVALVFAMTGGAYAASKVLITSTKQISPKVLASLKGATGKQGAAGPAGSPGATGTGTAGAAGPAGPAGTPGANGKEGAPGKDGAPGTPGKNGTTGFTKTLPSKSTETGVWSYGEIAAAVEELHVPISFPIPLSAGLDASHVHYINAAGKELNTHDEEVSSTACTGTAAAPTAEEGNLCVYSVRFPTEPAGLDDSFIQQAAGEPGVAGASTAGAILLLVNPHAETYAVGTWAVTAE
jgi:hypothetical protein